MNVSEIHLQVAKYQERLAAAMAMLSCPYARPDPDQLEGSGLMVWSYPPLADVEARAIEILDAAEQAAGAYHQLLVGNAK